MPGLNHRHQLAQVTAAKMQLLCRKTTDPDIPVVDGDVLQSKYKKKHTIM